MVGRRLVKHYIVKTDVKQNSTFSSNFQLNKIPSIISCFVLNKINKVEYIVTKNSQLFLICTFPIWVGKNSGCDVAKEGSMIWIGEKYKGGRLMIKVSCLPRPRLFAVPFVYAWYLYLLVL